MHGTHRRALASMISSRSCGRTTLWGLRRSPPSTTGAQTRYIFGALSPLQLACSFYKNSYLSHGTALHLHGLAPLETIFVNHEQSPKNSRPRISQAALNRAFQNSQRQSTYVFRYGTSTITFLNGKNTQGAGIVDM